MFFVVYLYVATIERYSLVRLPQVILLTTEVGQYTFSKLALNL